MEIIYNKTTREHYEKYRDLAERLGITLQNSKTKEFQRDYINERYAKDKHLNSIALRFYDSMYYSLRGAGKAKGLSMAEVTCLYKHLQIYEVLGARPIFEGEEECWYSGHIGGE